MVSAHPNWDDVADGYIRGSVGIFVEPVFVGDEDGRVASSDGAPDADTNAYAVSFQSGLGTAYGIDEYLVAFDAPRTAWEYANLATRYLEDAPDAAFAVTELQGKDLGADGWTPTGIVTDLGAEEVMRRMLGNYEYRLDEALPGTDLIESE